MPITVRQGTFLDLAEWIRMRALLWLGCSVRDHRIDTDRILKNTTEEILFVADRGDSVLAGFIEARLRPYADGCDTSPVGFVEGWLSMPTRRRGIGAALIAEAEAWAISRGCREMASDESWDPQPGRAAWRTVQI
jgi:aminoglycoside 6'-N-acetyltransferase I